MMTIISFLLTQVSTVPEDKIQRELRSLVTKEQAANIVSAVLETEGATDDSSRTIFADMIAAKNARELRLTAERQAVVNLIDRGTLDKINNFSESHQPLTANTTSLSGISARITNDLGLSSQNNDVQDDATSVSPQDANAENSGNVSDADKAEKSLEDRISRIQNLSRSATDLYLAALLSVNSDKIDLDHLLTASEKRGFELALRVLMRGNDNIAQDIQGLTNPELFSDVARLLEERDQCIRDAGRQYLDARKQSAILNGTSILQETAQKIRKSYDDRIQVCRTTYEQRFTEVVKGDNAGDLTSESADNDVRYLSRNLFIDVVARHVYEDQFLPIKVSACDSDPKSGFCSIDSLVVRDVVNDLISANTEYVTARAQPLFGFEIDGNQAVPTDSLKEIKRLPKPSRPIFDENCGGTTGIYCP